jgi:hypothetical protein
VSDGTAGDYGDRLLLHLMAQYEAPAYIRRARGVEAAYDDLLARCRRQRAEWLAGVRLHLGALRGLAGDGWAAVAAMADAGALERLRAEATAEVRPTAPVPTPARLRRAVAALRASVERFNRRWAAYLDQLDLGAINALRDGYNRYYLIEKECAVGSARLAALTFRELPPLTAGELSGLFPPLPVP